MKDRLAIALLIALAVLLWSAIGYNAWLHMRINPDAGWIFDTANESP